jgi:membrane associated rhomboid family serine protease
MDDYSSTTSDQNECWGGILTKLRGRPWFTWFISIVEIVVFIAELGKSWSLTGSPIQTKPSFNPLIGPSGSLLINMGARFAPCMYAINQITDDSSLDFPCPNYTGLLEQNSCTLSELCGFGGVSTSPNQWYRFITPIFLHGGFVHILINILTQISFGAELEKKIGILRLAIIYFASGIFGNVLGANFAPNGAASVGCSGSLFGIFPLFLLDLLYNWQKKSCCLLIVLLLSVVINLGLGLLPIIDNFAHIGGFVMGLLLGVALLTSPPRFRLRKDINTNLSTIHQERLKRFVHNRSTKWWIWWIVRFIALAIAIAIFVLSILNIYLWKVRCTWCRYINCLPVNDWCDIGYLTTINTLNSTLTTRVYTTT